MVHRRASSRFALNGLSKNGTLTVIHSSASPGESNLYRGGDIVSVWNWSDCCDCCCTACVMTKTWNVCDVYNGCFILHQCTPLSQNPFTPLLQSLSLQSILTPLQALYDTIRYDVVYLTCSLVHHTEQTEQVVKVIWQKVPHGGPIPRLGVTPGGRKLYHWIPGVGFPISVP